MLGALRLVHRLGVRIFIVTDGVTRELGMLKYIIKGIVGLSIRLHFVGVINVEKSYSRYK